MEDTTTRVRIALIDDEPQILSALKRELRSEPFDIVTFQDAGAGLEEILKGGFAAVVSDNLMPSLTGLELLAKVKEGQPLTRRLLLTGRTDLNHAVDAFNAGTIHTFLHKPWDRDKLLEALHKELDLYRSDAASQQSAAKLAEQSKARTAKLLSTMKELKQAQTQLVLIEDSGHLDLMKASADLRGLTVLIVEEHEAVRELLIKALRGIGISRCHGVPHANAALVQMTGSPRVDVVLSEWTMEGMDGLEFLRRLRASNCDSANALFLMMAGVEHKALVDLALKSGVDGYLIKPFHLDALLRKIESLRRQTDLTQLDDLKPLRSACVLVANSHPASRDQIEAFLHEAGVEEVARATFGQGALALIRERGPNVVLYDVNVKDPPWEELLKLLKKQPDPPAVLITGVFSDDESKKAIREAGVKHFLPGPFTQKDLLRAIADCWLPDRA